MDGKPELIMIVRGRRILVSTPFYELWVFFHTGVKLGPYSLGRTYIKGVYEQSTVEANICTCERASNMRLEKSMWEPANHSLGDILC
jgi:hypothetical protein